MSMLSSKVSVLISDKYNPDRGLQPFDISRYAGLAEQLNEFHSGNIDAATIADKIIQALFEADFSAGPKWDVDSSSLSLLSEGGYKTKELPLSFDCEQKATWDHKDIYAVARSNAKIVVQSRDLIHIVLYSFYVSG